MIIPRFNLFIRLLIAPFKFILWVTFLVCIGLIAHMAGERDWVEDVLDSIEDFGN